MKFATYDDDLLYHMEDGRFVRDGEPYTGLAREFSKDGELIAEDSFVNGIQEGPSRYWYPSGEMRGEEHFLNNGLHGPSKEWYRNGQLKRDAIFEHSILVSDKKWDENGKLVEDFQITERDPYFELLISRRSREKE